VEALQAFLPGRTAELTDPLLVVVMAIALALLEGPAAARATSATGTRPWWQQ
jgi:VanZ family protein